MEDNGLVSIVIPVYNSEKFLTKCLDSVLNQTYKDIEIIVVNDGSTDNSLKILQNYSDKIKIISQENQGLASALITGIKAMNGKWFKWFSPDDVMYPKTIEILYNNANKLGNNVIVYSNWDIIDEHEKKIRTFFETNFNDLNTFDFGIRLLDSQQINVNTTLIPFTLINNTTFGAVDDPVLLDYDFFLRASLLNNTKFYLVEQPLVKYRVHKKQLSHQSIVQSIKNLDTVRENALSNIDRNTKDKYLQRLDEYKKKKPFPKKTMDLGLKIISSLLPNDVTDKMLVYYLNKIRSNR